MCVLTAVFPQPRRVGLNVAGVVRPAVEWGCEKFDEPVASTDYLCIHGGHGSRRAFRIGAAGDDPPGLRDRVDTTFLAGRRAQRGSVVEISPAIPIAVPGLMFDGLLHGLRMRPPLCRPGGFTLPVGHGGELQQRGVQKPTSPA